MVCHLLLQADGEGPTLISHAACCGTLKSDSHSAFGRAARNCRFTLSSGHGAFGALRNGAPFGELPSAFRTLQQFMLKKPGGDREMVEILALVLQHDEQAVLTAAELALAAGAPTKMHILNLLHRLVDGKPVDAPPVKPPNALTLTTVSGGENPRINGAVGLGPNGWRRQSAFSGAAR